MNAPVNEGSKVKQAWVDNLEHDMGKQLMDYMRAPTITNIFVNPDGQVYVKEYKKGKYKTDLRLSNAKRLSIVNSTASLMGQIIDDDNPTVSGILPFFKCRFQAILPPWTEGPCMAIRKPLGKVLKLRDYVNDSQMSEEHYEILVKAVIAEENIVVAGPTDSGKTTFVNALMGVIADFCADHRMYIVEDTKELTCPVEDQVALEMPVSKFIQGLEVALRFAPKRIVFGELRHGVAANMLLSAWNTAHNGGFTTIHANSAKSTLKRIHSLIKTALDGEPDKDLICEAIQKVVFMNRGKNGPYVDQIIGVNPDLDGAGNFITNPL